MKFGAIHRLILFGGAPLMAELVNRLENSDYEVFVYSCERQLKEAIEPGLTLREVLENHRARFYSVEDIHQDKELLRLIDDKTLGLGLGEAWSFSEEILNRFNGRLLDFMGIPLPRYRGGAHYTWQILRQDRQGCCNLQLVNLQMRPGEFDNAPWIKRRAYQFPPDALTPQDYFKFAVEQETDFILEFLREVQDGVAFSPTPLREESSLYLPRLSTRDQAFINWDWNQEEIYEFISAFDDPYGGASSFIRHQRVSLKKAARIEAEEGDFHPFQSGLIYRLDERAIFVAVQGGALRIGQIRDESGRDFQEGLRVGDRFYTPLSFLESAMQFQAHYNASGLIK